MNMCLYSGIFLDHNIKYCKLYHAQTKKNISVLKVMCYNNDMYRKCSEELGPSDSRLVATGDYGGDGELGLTSNSDGFSVERKVSALEVLIEQHI